MKILTADQMARWDRLSIRKHGISAQKLMERAASQCVEFIANRITKGDRILIVCGPGNNGGDGLAMAGMLTRQGFNVVCFFTGKAEKLSPEARFFLELLETPPEALHSTSQLRLFKKSLRRSSVTIDALFGTGLSRKISGIYKKIIAEMNGAPGLKVAVDMPSGVSGDTGEVLGLAFRADHTVTFEAPKWGQVTAPGWEYVGRLQVRGIGLAKAEVKKMKSPAQWLDGSMVATWFNRRPLNTHKGKNGRLLVIAGSESMPGAGYLSALGALRAGTGLVSWALPEGAFQKIDLRYPEVILKPLPSQKGTFAVNSVAPALKLIKDFDAVALGPGWSQSPHTLAFLRGLLPRLKLPFVLDADGLNLLAKDKRLYPFLKNAVVTPHPKEFSRLVGTPVRSILANRLRGPANFSKQHHCWTVLKSYRSVLAGPKGEIFLNSTGGPNLAVAGSGDVLTGVIAGLLAQGKPRRQALLGGAYLHGRAGDLLWEEKGDRGTLASEVAGKIPIAIRELVNSQ